jgi:hypothetical protein
MKYEKGFKGDHGRRHTLNDPKLKQRKVYGRQDLNRPKLTVESSENFMQNTSITHALKK